MFLKAFFKIGFPGVDLAGTIGQAAQCQEEEASEGHGARELGACAGRDQHREARVSVHLVHLSSLLRSTGFAKALEGTQLSQESVSFVSFYLRSPKIHHLLKRCEKTRLPKRLPKRLEGLYYRSRFRWCPQNRCSDAISGLTRLFIALSSRWHAFCYLSMTFT